MKDFVTGTIDGELMLGIPFVSVAEYLSVPRWVRWTIYLAAALSAQETP